MRALACFAMLGAAVSCASESTCAPGEPPYLTIFMVDGMAPAVFERELAAGRLPNMARFIDEGFFVERGVTAFPSMTGYAFSPFITGRDAAASGLTGLRWFDRTRDAGNLRNYVGRPNVQMNGDIGADLRTVYEEFPHQCTTSFNTYYDRGVTDSIKTGWDFTMAKTRGHWWLADFLALQPFVGDRLVPTWQRADSNLLDVVLADLERTPKVQWITFPSPDTYSHIYGVDAEYVSIIRHIDSLVGRYQQASVRLGTEEQRVYALVTDHGVANASKNIDLRDAFTAHGLAAERGEAVILDTSELEEPLESLAETAAVVAINGNMMCHVYLRHPEKTGVAGWHARPERRHLTRYPRAGAEALDTIAALLELEGVELVVTLDDAGDVEVRTSAGSAVIHSEGGAHSYRVVDGVDPLGYGGMSLADGELHPEDIWLTATVDTGFPYAVPRLAALLAARGAGDLVVTSAPGYEMGRDFEMFVDNYRGGHGGLRADQMIVPAIIAGPGVRAGARVHTARTEDVGATLRALLGLPVAPSAEGRVLSGALDDRPGLVPQTR